MIEKIILFSIKNKLVIGIMIFILIGWGVYSLINLPVDAIPDITNNQVQIISLAPSLAVQEVENTITAPIEVSIANIPNIIELRSISRLGLSVITVVFKDDVDIYWARQQLNERLKEAEENIPPELAKIELAPISSGLGEIYQYRLAIKGGSENKYTAMDLRTIQDWIVRKEMLGTKGVADINSYGGFVKQYEIAVNPDRMKSLNLSLSDIFEALEKNNENTGSAYIDKSPKAYFIRGIGLIKSMDDIGNIVVKNSTTGGIPILIRDIATVQLGNATRYGAFVVDTAESVGGVVMMLKGGNAHEVIRNVENRIRLVQKSLPAGIQIEPFLNRSDLVDRAIGTVSRNLVEGALIVIFILILLLGNFRAGLIVASVIPLSMLFAISMMRIFGISGNLMSLGAIDFGLIVDGTVIIVESVVHRISKSKNSYPHTAKLTQQEMDAEVFEASSRIRKAATFGEFIILIVYLPILFLLGVEGKMFVPMAQVVGFAILGAFLLSLTYVPMVSALFLSKKNEGKRTISDQIMEKMHQWFEPLIDFCLTHKKIVISTAFLLFFICLFIFNTLGGEFIPQLEEGDLAAGVITLQGGSLGNTVETVKKANSILLKNFPEIKHTVCKIGAGEIPTDPTPMETGDYIITLRPKSEWRTAHTQEELVAKMEEALIPLAGVKFEFQQPIQMRFNELLSGSRQDVAVKIFGNDLNLLAEKAYQIEHIINNIDGVRDINVEKIAGLEQIQIEYKRDRLAQYGLSVTDINKILRTAFAGSKAGVVIEGDKRFGLYVRLDKDYRQDIKDVDNLSINLQDGGQIALNQVADVKIESGPAQVSREDAQRRITIGFNVRHRDVQSIIAEIEKKINKKIQLPSGYFITYGGQFENLEAAKKRLSIAVPLALLLIFTLLFFTFHSVKQSLLIFTAVPLSAMGGVFALWIRGMSFSISAGVGFIALFGVAVLNGIVLIAEFNQLENNGITNITERVKKALHNRLRPVIMTASVASLGFLPMALSTSAGAEVQKPLATVVIGGLISATLLTLIILPILYIIFTNNRSLCFINRIKIRKIFILLIVIVLCQFANAQNTGSITLDNAIRLALDSNLTVRGAVYNVDIQRTLRNGTWDIPKTSIEWQYGQLNSISKDNCFTVLQSFSFPTLYVNQNKLQKEMIKNADYQLKEIKLGVLTQVKQLYWKMVYLYSKKHLLQYQDSLFEKFLNAATLRAKIGETNKLEMISAQSQTLEVRNKLNIVASDISIFRNRLKIALHTDADFQPADTVLKPIEQSHIIDSISFKQHPTLAISEQQIQIAEIERKIERSKSLPDFSIGYFNQSIKGYQEIEATQRYFGASERFMGFQASVNIPLWFLPQSAKIKSAKIKEKLAHINHQNLVASTAGIYKELKEEYDKCSKSIKFYKEQAIPEAEAIIEQTNISYKTGAIDYLDYITSISRALTIKQSYLDVIDSYNQAVISIDYINAKNK